ncbi:MAG: GtrA family protein [Firmicutes bacterium]|nr:GtrA family protein [Bacillota bacterium]
MNLVRKYDEIIRYIIAGILTTIVSIASYNLLRNINIDYKICTILSWILAVIFAYFINKLFVFKSQKNNIKEFINFILARLLSLFIEFIFMMIMVDFININDRIAKLIVQFVVLVLNYVFSKFFVFKKI